MKRTREQGEKQSAAVVVMEPQPEPEPEGIAVTVPPNRYGALRDYRCRKCGRLMFRAVLAPGSRVQTVCWHGSCRSLQTVSVPGQAPA